MKDLGCRIQKELRLIKVGRKFFFFIIGFTNATDIQWHGI